MKCAQVCHDAPKVSNILFADDSLILTQAEAGNADCLRRILLDYSVVSRQMVSEQKSSIFFGPNTEVENR